MDFKNIKSYFEFSKDQRAGIFSLVVIMLFLQLGFFFFNENVIQETDLGKQKWLSIQSKFDALKKDKSQTLFKVYLFNPNFITDYKGYKLGMSVQEIDRLLAYRKENKYVNSAKQFQAVTQVSDSLLNSIAPLFKFPDWVNNKKERKEYVDYKNKSIVNFPKKEKLVLIDINKATQEDLIKIYGIGEVISKRILILKESLGGFVSMDQMKDVWGLSPEVIANLDSHFKIVAVSNLKKVNINNASLKEMAQFPYFKYPLAKEIIIYRSMNGNFNNIEDLINIKGFPVEKAKIIALYLDFN
ncbi:helix-hairpin-helix domain-containing protein [Flavobacterium sp. WC2421]|uniref:ComEA family DNA-binding protein n=1 Tax=Flavobacterium sp. WC2421 TaxID=3234138 RepID=UPI003466D09C